MDLFQKDIPSYAVPKQKLCATQHSTAKHNTKAEIEFEKEILSLLKAIPKAILKCW